MAVSIESADYEARGVMNTVIQDVVISGRSALTPTSPRLPSGDYFDGTKTTNQFPPRITAILECLQSVSGGHLTLRDRHRYVIPRGFGATSFVYLATDTCGNDP